MRTSRWVLFLVFVAGCFPKVWTKPTVKERTPAPVFIASVRDLSGNGFPGDALNAYLTGYLNQQGIIAFTQEDIMRGISEDTKYPNAPTSLNISVQRFQWRPVFVDMRVTATAIETGETLWQVDLTYRQRARKRALMPSELAQIITEQTIANTAR